MTDFRTARSHGQLMLDVADTLSHLARVNPGGSTPTDPEGDVQVRFVISEVLGDLIDRHHDLYEDNDLALYLPLEGLGTFGVSTAEEPDLSGNDRHGSHNGTLSTVRAKIGNGIQIVSGGNGYIEVSDHANLRGDQDFIVVLWTSIPDPSVINQLIFKLSDYQVWLAAGGNFFGEVTCGAGNAQAEATTFGAPSADTQVMVALRFTDATSTAEISVNGGAWDSDAGAGGGSGSVNDLRVGTNTGSTGDAGQLIDEVGFWKDALDDDCVDDLYASGLGFRPPGLLSR